MIGGFEVCPKNSFEILLGEPILTLNHVPYKKKKSPFSINSCTLNIAK